jgi:hypothetical protein
MEKLLAAALPTFVEASDCLITFVDQVVSRYAQTRTEIGEVPCCRAPLGKVVPFAASECAARFRYRKPA